MTDSILGFMDGSRLLVDLQQVNAIVKSFSGCLEPEAIAGRITDGLVENFGCAFARIWLIERDRMMLKLVASSGLYTRTNGDFSRVPIGAFKVGKIAQNQIPFLSNQLAEESWVKDRDWAIAHGIRGFAGYPLAVDGKSIGVLAVFSKQAMLPEFLEVLQSLCATATIALEAALRYQQEKQVWQASTRHIEAMMLSEHMATLLKNAQLTLVGTERAIAMPLTNLFLRAAEVLSRLPGIYSRLTYERDRLSLEAFVSRTESWSNTQNDGIDGLTAAFSEIQFGASCLGGTLQIISQEHRPVVRVLLAAPYVCPAAGKCVSVRCRSSVLQMAFSQLVYLSGLTTTPIAPPNTPLLTDDWNLIDAATNLLWIATDAKIPKQARAKLDLSINPNQLREAIAAVERGECWGIASEPEMESPQLSEREAEILRLLAQGYRDRDIAGQLIVSESTVKFHVNNIVAKLRAKTRLQALYLAIAKGWITATR